MKKKTLIKPYQAKKQMQSTADDVIDIKPKKKTKVLIKSTLKIFGRTFKAEGKTIEEAILNLNPTISKGLGVITLEKGKIKKEKIVPANIIYRIFNEVSPTMKTIALKGIYNYFDPKVFN